MATETITGIDLHSEYCRIRHAVRVAATLFIVLAAAWFWTKYQGMGQCLVLFENIVSGGIEAAPPMVRTVVSYSDLIAVIAAIGGLGAIALVWFGGRSISHAIYGGTGGVICYLIIGIVFEYACTAPMRTILVNFSG